jgi:hypothetical protein
MAEIFGICEKRIAFASPLFIARAAALVVSFETRSKARRVILANRNVKLGLPSTEEYYQKRTALDVGS